MSNKMEENEMKNNRILCSVKALALTLIATVASFSAWATPITLSGNATDGYYVDMPENASTEATAKELTLDGSYTFNIYGDNGKGNRYSSSYEGFLLITAPSGYAIRLSGTWYNVSQTDNLYIYNGPNSSSPQTRYWSSVSQTNNLAYNSTSNSVLIHFKINGNVYSSDAAYINLTATVAPITDLSVAAIDMQAMYGYNNGEPVVIDDYSVSLMGAPLTKDVDYTASIDGQNSTTASSWGTHTLTITAIANSGYTGSQSVVFTLGEMDWAFLQAQFNQGNHIKLANDVTAASSDYRLSIPSSQKVVLDLNGHKIDRNLSSPTDWGSVFEVRGTLTVCDNSTNHTGVITGGNNTGDGGAFYLTGGTLTLQGGNITGNHANNGGGIYADNDDSYSYTSLKIQGGIITNNTASENGGGVYLRGQAARYTMEGAPVIRYNTVNSAPNNLFLAARKNSTSVVTAFMLSAPLIQEQEPMIGITSEVSGTQEIAYSWRNKMNNANPSDYFFADRSTLYAIDKTNDGSVIIKGRPHDVSITKEGSGSGDVTPSATSVLYGDEVTLTVSYDENNHLESISVKDDSNHPVELRQTDTKKYVFTMPNLNVTVTATFEPGAADMTWFDIQHAFDAGDDVTLTNDVTAPAGATRLKVYAYNYKTDTWGKSVKLDLNGHILSRGLSSPTEDGQVIYVYGATLTLKDGNPTATHSGTSLTGGILTGGYSGTSEYNGDGGGILVEELNESYPSILIMEGGTIAGNKTTYEGAGVRVLAHSNSSNYNRYAAFEMIGGMITDNECTGDSGVGGGVSIRDGWSGAKSYFKMTGGTISNNRAKTAGGLETHSDAIVNIDNVDVPTVSISGGSIINNTATAKAGGIHAHNNINLSGNPDISGNTCGGSDSNIYLDRYYDNGYKPCTINIVGNLTNTTPIGVSVSDDTKPTESQIRVITSNLGDYGSLSSFASDQGYVMRLESGEVAFIYTVIPTLTLHSAKVLGETKYICSFYNSAIAFQLSEGAKAYTVHLDGDDAVFYRIGDNSDIIPEDCPVIIISDTPTATLTPATFTGTKDPNNALRATPSKKYGGDLWASETGPYPFGLYIYDGNIAFQRLDDSSQFEAGTVYILK